MTRKTDSYASKVALLLGKASVQAFLRAGGRGAEVAAVVPAGRFAVPADLSGMAVFLASAEADYIVSQTYNVDGGQWMS